MVKKSRRHAVIDKETCVACGSCVDVCPQGALRIYKGCYAQVDEERCVGCGRCARECPASAIQVVVRP